MKKQILIIEPLDSCFYDGLREKGISFDEKYDLHQKDLSEFIHPYYGLVLRGKYFVDKQVIDHAKHLKFIGRPGSGLDNIDKEYAKTKGIVCVNSPEGNANAVGEYCLGMLLTMMSKYNLAQQNFHKNIWDRKACRGVELKNKTVAIIGYGPMGKSFARKVSPLCQKVIVYDKYLSSFGDEHILEVGWDDIFKEADVLSIHLPLTEETRKILNADFFSRFAKPFFLINSSRGEIAVEPDVLDAVNTGKIQAACLDVLSVERFPDLYQKEWFSLMLIHPNIYLTPHIAGSSDDSEKEIARVLLERIEKQVYR